MNEGETIFLDLDDLLVIGERLLGHRMEASDWGLLESSLARPRASIFGDDAYPGIVGKAAALLASLAGNHALIDGNKRLAIAATAVFLGLNGHTLNRATDDELFDLVMDVAGNKLTEVEKISERLTLLTDRNG
jgi:death-on-curing protein